MVFFIVENKNWLDEYPNVLKERFSKKLEKLYKEIICKNAKLRPEPPKIKPYNDFQFNIQNKINTFNRATKSPLYNSRNLMYQGRKYIEFKTPKSRNSSRDLIEKGNSKTALSDSRPDIFNFDNIGVNIDNVKLNSAKSIIDNHNHNKNKNKLKIESKSEPRTILSDKYKESTKNLSSIVDLETIHEKLPEKRYVEGK